MMGDTLEEVSLARGTYNVQKQTHCTSTQQEHGSLPVTCGAAADRRLRERVMKPPKVEQGKSFLELLESGCRADTAKTKTKMVSSSAAEETAAEETVCEGLRLWEHHSLKVECPLQAPIFAHLVPSWGWCFGKL